MKNLIFKFYRCRKILLSSFFILSIISSVAFMFLLGEMGPSQHSIPGTDYFKCYRPFAVNVLEGRGIFIGENNHVCSPPGYPLYLVPIVYLSQLFEVNELKMILFFNILTVALSSCLLFLIADHFFNRKVSIIASFLWLSYPFSLWFLKNPNTEIPFIMIMFLGIWLLLSSIKRKRYQYLFFVGIVFGLATLIRPIALLLPLLISFLMPFLIKEEAWKRKISFVGLLFLGGLIPVIVWELVIIFSVGQFILLSSSGPQAVVDGLTFSFKAGEGGDRFLVSEDALGFMERARNGELKSGARIASFLWQETINHPLTVLKIFYLKLTRAWYATSQMWWEGKIFAIQLPYLLLAVFGIIYSFLKCREKRNSLIFLLALILYFWLMTVAALSILRYMVPAMSFVVIFSAVSLSLLVNFLARKLLKR